MSEETYSVQLRVRRVTYDYAYVAVPLTSQVTKEHPDGSVRSAQVKINVAG
jgi:hypothetical protein